MNENTQNKEGIMKKIGLCILASALLLVGCAQDMAKNMGVSYPTVRNILDDLIDKLNKIE